jgi:hypothetical protein
MIIRHGVRSPDRCASLPVPVSIYQPAKNAVLATRVAVLLAARTKNNKSSLLLSFKKEDSSFLKKRSKRLLIPYASFTIRVCSAP